MLLKNMILNKISFGIAEECSTAGKDAIKHH